MKKLVTLSLLALLSVSLTTKAETQTDPCLGAIHDVVAGDGYETEGQPFVLADDSSYTYFQDLKKKPDEDKKTAIIKTNLMCEVYSSLYLDTRSK